MGNVNVWIALLVALITFITGAIVSFFWTRKKIQKHIEANPPISAKQIRAMYISMGRKPTEAQINKTLRAMNIRP